MIEQIINEMQASLTKLRGQLRDGGKAEYKELHRQVGEILTEHLRGMAEQDIYARHKSSMAREAREEFEKELAAGESKFEKKTLKFVREFFKAYPNTFFVAMPKCHKCGKHFEWVAGGGSHNLDCSEYTCPDCNKLRTAGECTCADPMSRYPNCPIHCPLHSKGFRERATIPGIIEESTPDLPLNARVAKALGQALKCDNGKWLRGNLSNYPLKDIYESIPDYPTDLKAAMGALEKYCRGKKNYSICYYPDFPKTLRISIWDLGSGGLNEINVNCPLPQAICLAIVAHREGK